MPATPAWPPKSAPRLFVEQELSADTPVTVEGNQAHYLSKVMRVAPGDAVILCDDMTGEWAAEVIEAGKRRIVLQPRDHQRPREAVPDFWLCPALLKKDRFDLVLENGFSVAADDADDVSSAARSERRVGYATGAAVDSGEEARPPKRLPRLSEPSGSVKSSSGVAPEQTT